MVAVVILLVYHLHYLLIVISGVHCHIPVFLSKIVVVNLSDTRN